jgi:hypothetical protein
MSRSARHDAHPVIPTLNEREGEESLLHRQAEHRQGKAAVCPDHAPLTKGKGMSPLRPCSGST